MQPNIVAALCYVGLIVGGFFWPLSLIAFAVPIAFLVIEPYKNVPLIRFHAVQSLILNITFFIVFLALGTVFGVSNIGWFFSGTLGTYLMLLYLFRLVRIGCGMFLIAKAYVNQPFAIPGIGEVASKLADQIKL